MLKKDLFLLAGLLVFSCSSLEKGQDKKLRRQNTKAEYIARRSDTYFYPLYLPPHRKRELYPWEKGEKQALPKISREFFQCKGSSLNLPMADSSNPEKVVTLVDCDGRHLIPFPVRIYPILIELLNYVQEKTQKRVVITSGYRCPKHNLYVAGSKAFPSKHLIGAEVDFYVESYEDKPEKIVQLIFDFYKKEKRYFKNKDYQVFFRFDGKTNVSTAPWYNKEVFIKLFQSGEGRDFDNRHPYPYLSIQVRYDREKNKRVLLP
ncbi:MAG: D-Ala-D-Ala carboxypeptidase family metallohydrolase [Parachlamydiales bacterium]|jgi:hypothetical protein